MTTPDANRRRRGGGAARGGREPWWQRLVTGQSTAIALILVGLIVVFSFLQPEEFFDVNNARNIATDAAVLLVLAVGLTFVIIGRHRPLGRRGARLPASWRRSS